MSKRPKRSTIIQTVPNIGKNFTSFNKEEKEQIRNDLIAFITSPTTRILHSKVLLMNDKDNSWLELDSWNNTNIVFFTNDWRMIKFKKLPLKIALLLGITYRRFFERYKEVVQNV